MPRSSSASCQASLARATSSLQLAVRRRVSSEGLLRRAVSSRPTAATRIAAAVTAPNTQPAVIMVRANAGVGSSILQDVADEQEDRRGGSGEDGGEDGDDGDGARAGGSAASPMVAASPIARRARLARRRARGGRRGGRRRAAQFLADLHVVLVLGRRGRRDERGGVERHGAQLFGVEPLSDSGQFRAVWCGAQRLIEDPLVLLAVLAQQVLRNAVHVHPPMLRRAWGSHANEPSGRNGGEPATDKPMVERSTARGDRGFPEIGPWPARSRSVRARDACPVNVQMSSGSCWTSSFPAMVTPPSIAMASPSA